MTILHWSGQMSLVAYPIISKTLALHRRANLRLLTQLLLGAGLRGAIMKLNSISGRGLLCLMQMRKSTCVIKVRNSYFIWLSDAIQRRTVLIHAQLCIQHPEHRGHLRSGDGVVGAYGTVFDGQPAVLVRPVEDIIRPVRLV